MDRARAHRMLHRHRGTGTGPLDPPGQAPGQWASAWVTVSQIQADVGLCSAGAALATPLAFGVSGAVFYASAILMKNPNALGGAQPELVGVLLSE